MLSAERLREEINYNPDTGEFSDLHGSVLGWSDHGYRRLNIGGVKVYAHRLAWLYMTGQWPTNKIDHFDGDKGNNRFSNLREATDRINAQNVHEAQSNNSTGFLGVSPKRKRFEARIYREGSQIRLGIFDSPEAAHAAYVVAKRIHHEGCTI